MKAGVTSAQATLRRTLSRSREKIRLFQRERQARGRALLERVHVLDTSSDPEYAMPDYQHVANNRTMLGVPLLRDDRRMRA
jgi:hypothetical protein